MLAGFAACSNVQSQEQDQKGSIHEQASTKNTESVIQEPDQPTSVITIGYINSIDTKNIRETKLLGDSLRTILKDQFDCTTLITIYILAPHVCAAIMEDENVDFWSLSERDYFGAELYLHPADVDKLASYSGDSLFFEIADGEILGQVMYSPKVEHGKLRKTTDPKAVKI
jgi:hypothetical protein